MKNQPFGLLISTRWVCREEKGGEVRRRKEKEGEGRRRESGRVRSRVRT
jgi:hypothetical protein